MKKRLDWVDYSKGICMIIVVFYHTLCYYVKDTTLTYTFFPFFLTYFFFISGYLIDIDKFSFQKSAKSIFKKLIIPYFIFTTIIWIPKTISHGNEISLLSYIFDIGGGYASWFVAALVVAKLFLSSILYTTKSLKQIWLLSVILITIGFVSTIYVNYPAPWYFNWGLISLLYIVLGCTYRRYQDKINIISKKYLLISIFVYIILIIIDKHYSLSTYYFELKSGPLSTIGLISYFILSISGIWMMLNVTRYIPSGQKYLQYIGENSLIYYFLNGGVITVLVTICNRIGFGYDDYIYREVVLLIATILILTFASIIIVNYFPWMVGLNHKKKNI